MTDTIRKFDTGATRSSEAGRYDPEGFLSPIVLERYCEYMNSHRVQPDGSIRGSDNWQRGLPRDTYMKGMFRHMLHLWTRHRGFKVQDPLAAKNAEEDLCALLFNVQGYLFEILKRQALEGRAEAAPSYAQKGADHAPTEPGSIAWVDSRGAPIAEDDRAKVPFANT